MEPKPVRIVLPDGREDLGILADDSTVDMGVVGLELQANDVLIVDGRLVTVVRTIVERSLSCGTDARMIEEASFRVRLGPYPRARVA
jgi:hypothetical protein